MATLVFDGLTLILDSADADSPATIGFESDDCDRDFQAFVGRGAVSFEPPENKPWGIRCAYLEGPG
ncbi:MAG: Glyoxalase-like domain, partial [Verrucomicrobiota bacterium]